MTATCERPPTSVRNASVLPSGELRGDITRVMGPTRRLPFQVGGGASICLPRNQWPRNAPPAKKARPRARTSANSRTRRAFAARVAAGVPTGVPTEMGSAALSSAGIGDFVVGSGGGASDGLQGRRARGSASARGSPGVPGNSASFSRICLRSRTSSAVVA